MSRTYFYRCEIKEDGSIIQMKNTVDSGRVRYTVLGTTVTDSTVVWTVEERDTLIRTVDSLWYGRDTVYVIIGSVVFSVVEDRRDTHQIATAPNVLIWEFSTRWGTSPDAPSGRPVFRFSGETLTRIQVDTATGPALLASSGDSLVFRRDIGLV